MAEMLYRLGTFAARRPWRVITAWIIVLAIATGGFLAGFGGLSSSFDIPGTASGKVADTLADELPDYSGASGTVVFSTTDGSQMSDSQREQVSALITDGDGLADVATIVDPFDTEIQRAGRAEQLVDGRQQIEAGRAQLDAAQAQLDAGRQQLTAAGMPTDQLDAQQTQLTASGEELEAQSRTLQAGAELLGLADGIRMVSEDGSTALVTVAFTEPRLELSEEAKQGVIDHFESQPIDGVEVSFSTDIAQGVPQIFGVGEAIGLVFAAVVLFVMLGSVLAASFPIITALVGVAIGVVSTLAFSGLVQMASVTPVLGIMLGLAVGIDYSLFIINRHRKQLLKGAPIGESIGLANGTAGNAVVFAGVTVIVALLALNVTGVPFLGLMGTAGAACVAVAVLIAITLTPAILGLAGERIIGRRARAAAVRVEAKAKPVKPMSTFRAIATVIAAVVALLIIAIPSLSMRLGLPDGGSEPAGSASERAFSLTAEKFGEGATGPLLVTATLPDGLDDDQLLTQQLEIARTIAAQDDVTAVAPIDVSADNTLTAFQVIPAEGPNSVSTAQLVEELRALPPIDGSVLGVAGQAASNIDISESLDAVLPFYLAVVVGLSLLIMILVFRSLLVPLIATGGFILSLFATFGATVAVFQWGWFAEIIGLHSTGPILSFLPIILTGILFGLAMDYQLFLATGMREAYVHGSPARLAVAQGFRAGRSVVVAACLIMVSVFGGFVFSEATIIRSIGFGLAIGVLLDAFVVRMLLMPALMHLLGRSAWWIPRWLDRILPDVDVEGSKLERRHAIH
ncbi:RND superfamily putative drug exporter [Homoserinimonas aerilata]|uniref:RND superfamily putative drug exporter n=1 Tax=Homoserinimonas aerilata TaxID=1162970 RepID=A0A542YAI5_9MICO|nr:MMPL family transporter [Homoserinimonas aerilata]TQL44974.1 RND superfamily putative drug exporter [Homoserinimonas aerilata]